MKKEISLKEQTLANANYKLELAKLQYEYEIRYCLPLANIDIKSSIIDPCGDTFLSCDVNSIDRVKEIVELFPSTENYYIDGVNVQTASPFVFDVSNYSFCDDKKVKLKYKSEELAIWITFPASEIETKCKTLVDADACTCNGKQVEYNGLYVSSITTQEYYGGNFTSYAKNADEAYIINKLLGLNNE